MLFEDKVDENARQKVEYRCLKKRKVFQGA